MFLEWLARFFDSCYERQRVVVKHLCILRAVLDRTVATPDTGSTDGSGLFEDGSDIVTKIDVEGDASDASGVWNRSYLLPRGQRYTVTSVKRFDPDAGLLECLGRGFVMHLDLYAEPDALHFVSAGYAWHCGPVKIPLPRLLSPGDTHVIHRELGGGRFRFTLSIRHPWLGELAYQEGDFFEREGPKWKP